MAQEDPFKKTGSSRWFDGYDNNQTLIYDDFGGGRNKLPLCDFLVYLDRYPVQLPVKGSFVQRTCTKIIVTSNLHPRTWYDYGERETQYDALARRFTKIIVFTTDGAYEQDNDLFFNHWFGYGRLPNKEKPYPLPWEHDSEADLLGEDEDDDSNMEASTEDTEILEEPVLLRNNQDDERQELEELAQEADAIMQRQGSTRLGSQEESIAID
jgi:hypothetical protein